MEFKKFVIKKNSWWRYKDFNIYDENDEVVYKVRGEAKVFKYITSFTEVETGNEYSMQRISWVEYRHELTMNGDKVAMLLYKARMTQYSVELHPEEGKGFIAKGKTMENNYQFARGENEIGMVSMKLWPKFEFGLVVEKKEYVPFYIAAVLLIAEIKKGM